MEASEPNQPEDWSAPDQIDFFNKFAETETDSITNSGTSFDLSIVHIGDYDTITWQRIFIRFSSITHGEIKKNWSRDKLRASASGQSRQIVQYEK